MTDRKYKWWALVLLAAGAVFGVSPGFDPVVMAAAKAEGLPMCPGIATAADYLAVPEIVCCGGTWIVPKDALAADDWTAIEKLAADAAALVRRLRE